MRACYQFLGISLIVGTCFTAALAEQESGEKEKAGKTAEKQKQKPIAGKADVMRHVRKQFATLIAVDEAGSTIRLKVEGKNDKDLEKESKWPILPDAELKIHGWWGRLEQLRPGDRLWIWFLVDRDKKPKSILMIADEMSEQNIHGTPLVVKAKQESKLTLHVPDEDKVPERELEAGKNYAGPSKPGATLYAQTSGGTISEGVTPEKFEVLRTKQRNWLRERWRKQGLPGSVTVLHPLGGEMDVLLDHEAMRWGRYLKSGDRVKLHTERPIHAVVKSVQPWRERTLLRLVPNSGLDILDLKVSQRIALTVPEPPREVQNSFFPTDIGRLEKAGAGKQARVDWFLSTIYCSCGVQGDRCTGMFYVQSSCNINACGMPNEMARIIGGHIDKGMSDREIFTKLKEKRGRDFWQPHLLR